MGTLTLTVGRLLCGSVRDFLDQCKFLGMDIEYIESSGWIERDFTIKGSDQHLLEVKHTIEKWGRDNNLS